MGFRAKDLSRTQVQSLVGELRSNKLGSAAKKEKKKNDVEKTGPPHSQKTWG